MAHIVSFINFKGGVGKTTICVEVAASLASKFEARVLLIDLDPQTNATLYLMNEEEWESRANSKLTMRDFFQTCYERKPASLSEFRWQYDKCSVSGQLHLLPSHLELFGMDLELATKFGHDNLVLKLFLRNALKGIEKDYDFILIDCPPNLYLITQNGLFASDQYVIVAMAEYLSTLGLAHIQRCINRIFEESRASSESLDAEPIPRPDLLGILFNRVRYRTGGTKSEESIIGRIREQYPNEVFAAIVSQSTKIADRAEQKVPIALSGYAQDIVYENQLRDVAEEFYERATRPSNE